MQARLRAQLGDWPKYSGERRRRSVVVASMVLTITDPLRGSYPLLCYLQAALIRPYGASFACMELTIISRFQRLQASTKIVTSFAIFMVFQCFQFSQLIMQRGLKHFHFSPHYFFTLLYVSLLLCHAGFNRVGKFLALQAA